MSRIAAIKDDTDPGTWVQVMYRSGRFVFGLFVEKIGETTLVLCHPDCSETLVYIDDERDKATIEYIMAGPMVCTYYGQFKDALAREKTRQAKPPAETPQEARQKFDA